MPQVALPLTETDFQMINCTRDEFSNLILGLPQTTKPYVVNATHRLAECAWVTSKLEDEVARRGPPVAQEGLLSLQIYLLLTCADTLGHVFDAHGVRQRFDKFFSNLPRGAQESLTESILTWRTTVQDLVGTGLMDSVANVVQFPSRVRIEQQLQPLSREDRLEAVVGFLYTRRNQYTHEADYPQAGYHPNLAVMQNQRLHVPTVASQGEVDRRQATADRDHIYLTYYVTEDPIETLRRSIVRGLGHICGLY